ncbi:type II secretion system protein N [Maricaulis sp.]|uniref:type II secretion system protein N n=1 Tax=Maricaulis sp. TaxID=1486257 RepID=UPI003A9565D4
MIGRVLLVVGLLLVWLIALMPLKLVALAAGGAPVLGYRDVFGTVWDGRVYGLELNGVPVSELDVSLDPLALVTGRIGGEWRVSDRSLRGSGTARLSGSGLQLEATRLVVTLERLGLDAIPGLDPRERVFVSLDRLDYRDGRCHQASGSARTGALIGLARLYGQDGPDLAGEVGCEDGRMVLDWVGVTEGLSLEGRVSFRPEGYDWQASVETSWPDFAEALALAGMQRDGSVWIASGTVSLDAGTGDQNPG